MRLFCLQLLLITGFLGITKAKEVTIIDTRSATSDLGWPSTPGGWTEVTSTDETDADLRTFEVCRIQRPDQNNWFHTPYLNVSGANRVYIEIRFAIRSCQGIRKLFSCKNTFNVFYLPSNSPSDSRAPQMNEETYNKLDTIAAGKRFDAGSTTSFTDIKVIPFLSSAGLYVAFQDTGACMSIIYVRVFHKVCSETVVGLARFPVTGTGQEMTSLIEVRGKCVQNARKSNLNSGKRSNNELAPILHCNSDGNWLLPSGNCFCSEGYEPNHDLTACEECPTGKYKPAVGNRECSACPLNSHSPDSGAVVCKCVSGHFRAPTSGSDTPCYRTSGAPLSPKHTLLNLSVILTWSAPRDVGGVTNVTYSIVCNSCDSSYDQCHSCSRNVLFHPRRFQLQQKSVTVDGLLPGSHYIFKISSFNLVSSVSNLPPAFVEVKVRTSSEVSPAVGHLRVVSVSSNNAVLRWSPSSMLSSRDILYQIQYNSGQKENSMETSQTAVVLQHLQPHTRYSVKVRSRVGDNYGDFCRAITFQTKQKSDNDYDEGHMVVGGNKTSVDVATQTYPAPEQNHLVLAISFSCTSAVIFLAVLVILCEKRKRLTKSSSDGSTKYPVLDNSRVLLTHQSTYVDPTIYEDPYMAVHQFAKEINPKAITLKKNISSGEFGDISIAVLNTGSLERTVAVKSLQLKRNNDDILRFLAEASLMGQFNHPNIIRLVGVVSKSRPCMILTEYMGNGSLDLLLKKSKGKLRLVQLVSMLQNISLGMDYLIGLGYVHRNLAARNILVDDSLHCKITNFQLSSGIPQTAEEEISLFSDKNGTSTFRWCAPEVISDHLYTSASDVWSFGVVTWEVMSYGERPYWEMSHQDITQFVESGYRLPSPCYSPICLHKMMLECWHHNYRDRPLFGQLVTLLNRFLDDPSLLEKQTNIRPPSSQDDCVPEMMDLSSLSRWLDEIHLLHYKPAMLRHGCVTAEQIMRLNEEELNLMGINDRNDVNTILQEAGILRFKIEEVNKIGVAV